MKLTSSHLRRIIGEEMRRYAEGDDAGADRGGDEKSAPAPDIKRDVEKAGKKIEQHLSQALLAISSEDEFEQLMTMFLKLASKHPSVTPIVVKKVLVGWAKKVAS